MEDSDSELLKLVNGSGFAFQIGVRKEIEKTFHLHGWRVEAEEHRWHHPKAGRGGYIDLVLWHVNYIYSLLLECKRVKEDGRWLFLTPRGCPIESQRISAFCTNRRVPDQRTPDACDFFGWCDFDFEPPSPEAAYCVLHGQDERNPMLERIADDLLPAVEAVGVEEVEIKSADALSIGEWRLHLPIIVTNATLFTADFDAERVSMASGRLAAGDCEFKPVPFIRFRKSLSTHYPRAMDRSFHSISLGQTSRAKERTVLVINSAMLAEGLRQLTVSRSMAASFGQLLNRLRLLMDSGVVV